jgi:hypothetical protein
LSLRPVFPGSSEIVAAKRIPFREPNRRHRLALVARGATVTPCFGNAPRIANGRLWCCASAMSSSSVGSPSCFDIEQCHSPSSQTRRRSFHCGSSNSSSASMASAKAPDSIKRMILAFAVGCRACKRGQARAITSPASAGVKVCARRMRSCSSLNCASRAGSNGMTVAGGESFAGRHAPSANNWAVRHKKSRRGQRRRHRKVIRKRLTRIRVGFGAAAESCVPPARLPLAVRRIQAWTAH